MPDEFKFRALTGEDWKDIQNTSLEYKDGLTLKEDEKDGSYESPFLNSGIPECQWHRIRLKADIPENATITLSFSTSDHKGPENDEPEKWYGCCVFKNVRDGLIQAPSGQYIRLKIELHREGEILPVLEQVKVYYPRLSYLRYLPEVYQEDSESREFLEMYLSIFESALYDSEETISCIPLHFDPMAAPEEFYRWLADWMSIDLYQLLGDKNREFILHAVDFYKQKGTASGLASLVSFLTGHPCFVKEYMNNIFRSYGMEHKERDETDVKKCVENFENSKDTKFFHTMSRTPDTKNHDLLTNMGKYCDSVHYVMDTRVEEGRYSPHVVGLFILLHPGKKLFVNKDELLKIVHSFLPVFVRAEINIVELPYEEEYHLDIIKEEYEDCVHGFLKEQIRVAKGVYRDSVSWTLLHSYDKEYNDVDVTNNLRYRTFHSRIGVEFFL